jgi:predicted DCC family thiol-disulfide oxidoreductase YuxK
VQAFLGWGARGPEFKSRFRLRFGVHLESKMDAGAKAGPAAADLPGPIPLPLLKILTILKTSRRVGCLSENGSVPSSRRVVVIFDGECVFCNRWVDFLMRFDRRDVFRFAARQSASGRSLMREVGLPESGTGSIIVLEHKSVLLRSDAVLRMMNLLGFPFSIAEMFRFIPRTLRDSLYEWFAKNRLKWFGRRQNCRLPSAAEHHRFL